MKERQRKKTIIINCKRWEGKEVNNLVERLNNVDEDLLLSYDIILAVQVPDAIKISRTSRFRIFIQDIFSVQQYCFLEYFKYHRKLEDNIAGVILNHPEKKLNESVLKASIAKANELELETIICATSIDEAIAVNKYAPNYIGIENETLIGKDVSFTDHCPEIVQQAKLKLNNNVLIGAGIRNAFDFRHVINSGGAGVLVSSLILKSPDPGDALMKILN